jgi:hypothetical protein
VLVCRRDVTPFSRNRRAIRNINAGACSFVDETSHPSAETEERFATSTPERCSFVDETSHPSAETEERFATSTPERCSFIDETSPPAAEAKRSSATSTPERCPFAAVRSAPRSRSHEKPHAQQLPDGCPVNVTRSTLRGRSHEAHLAPRIPDCPVTVTRSTLRGRSHKAHLAPRIPDGSPAAVRSTPSSRNRKTAHAHRLSDGCPVAAIRSEPCDSEATEHVTHLDSRTGSPVAVRSAPSSRNRKTTRAHRLLDGCPVAAIRLLRHSREAAEEVAHHNARTGARSRHAQPSLAETRGDVAHIDSRTVPGRSTLSRRWPKPVTTSRTSTLGRVPGAPRHARPATTVRLWRESRSATSRTGVRSRYARSPPAETRDDVAHIDFRTGARSPSHALPAPAEAREDVTYTDCRTGVPVPAHPAHDQRTNSARPGRALQGRGAPVDDRSRQRLLARLRSTTRSTRHPPATEAVRVRRIQP